MEKVDTLLLPVLKEYDTRSEQLRIDQFLAFSQRFAKIRSKRLQSAVAGIRGGELPEGGPRGTHSRDIPYTAVSGHILVLMRRPGPGRWRQGHTDKGARAERQRRSIWVAVRRD
jgi:hypothetical protein